MWKTPLRLAPLALVLTAGIAQAAPPAFWHWYHAYDQSMQTCGRLIDETMENIDRNWTLSQKSLNQYDASFTTGNTRGFLRCLSRGSGASWVVIIASGGGSQARTVFDDMKVVVCGNC